MTSDKPKSPARLPFVRAPHPDFLERPNHDPGYKPTQQSESGRILELLVEQPEDIHYLLQSPGGPKTYLRFQSGALFSVDMTLDELWYELGARQPFAVTQLSGTPSHHDVALETLRVLKTNPRAIMLDLSEAVGAPISLFRHPSDSTPGGKAVYATLAQCLGAGRAAHRLESEDLSQADIDATIRDLEERLVTRTRGGAPILILK